MRIALFVETYLPLINGVVTHVKILKDGLEQLGHTVLVVTADKEARHHYVKDDVLHCPAIEVKRFYGFGVAPPLSHTRLAFIKDFNPDVIHIHTEFGIGLSGVMAAKKLGKPLVYTLHTMYDEYIYYVSPKPFVKMTTSLSHRYSRFLAKKAGAITGPSQKCQEYIASCGVDKDVSVIPNPVELDQFSAEKVTAEDIAQYRRRLNLDGHDLVACFVGRLGREKSVDVLLRYWADSITPEDHMHLVVIGDGPERPGLMELARELGIEEMVTFPGKVMHDQLRPYYAVCDVYVTASLSDTNSISMLEGMAMGLPVLQRYDELNKDQIKDGENGFTFDSPAQFGQRMRQIKTMSPEELAALKRRTHQSVLSAGATDLARKILPIYEGLCRKEERA